MQSPVLFRIASNLSHVQVQVDIDESDVDGLTPGEPATFEVQSYPGAIFHGTVAQLRLQPVAEQTATATAVGTATASPASSAVATVVSYTAIIDVANTDERLRPGMTAEVALGGSRRRPATTRTRDRRTSGNMTANASRRFQSRSASPTTTGDCA
jgi:HlyD family secretion protein